MPQAELFEKAVVTFNDGDDIFVVRDESGSGRPSRPVQLVYLCGGPARYYFRPVQFGFRMKAGSGQCGKVIGVYYKLPAFAPLILLLIQRLAVLYCHRDNRIFSIFCKSRYSFNFIRRCVRRRNIRPGIQRRRIAGILLLIATNLLGRTFF